MDFFHLLNRGVDKRNTYTDEIDYVRFLHDCYVFNDIANVDPNHRFKDSSAHKRNPLVAIHAFCLMPNHYHMLVSEIENGGISLFMRKLNMGYAKYFNEKYKRSGVLWQGTFKKIYVSRDAYFMYLPYYIHLNPLDLALPEWRTGSVRNVKKALEQLRTYRWSSFMDYNGIKNMPSLITKEHIGELLGAPKNQESEIRNIISTPSLAKESNKLEH